MVMMAGSDLLTAPLMAAVGMSDSMLDLLMGFVGAAVIGCLTWGTYKGKKKWAFYGCGYYLLESVVSMLVPRGASSTVEGIDVSGVVGAGNLASKAVLVVLVVRHAIKMEE
jgi:hypothetical protein